MFHPGQMDLYPDASHILGDLAQHIGPLKIKIVYALHVDQDLGHRWGNVSCHGPDLMAQGIGSGEVQGAVEANDEQTRIGFAIRVFTEVMKNLGARPSAKHWDIGCGGSGDEHQLMAA